jgi:hypothetical protein
MFWPTKGDLGWFFEPTWAYNPKNGQHSFAASVGLLIGIPVVSRSMQIPPVGRMDQPLTRRLAYMLRSGHGAKKTVSATDATIAPR